MPDLAPPTPADLLPGGLTLAQVIVVWQDAKQGRSGSQATAQTYVAVLGAFRAALQAVGLDLASDPRAVALLAQGWVAHGQAGQALAPATVNKRLAILTSFYQFAIRHQVIAGPNPIDLVERPIVQPYAQAAALSAPEVKDQLRAIDRTTLAGLRDYALLGLYLQTGRRLAEIASLAVGDLEPQGEQLIVHIRRAKGGKVVRDRIPPALSRTLRAWVTAFYGDAAPPASPLWVSLSRNSRGQPLSMRSIATICQQRLGISKVHALRHTFARVMEDAGATVSDIQARLGHQSLATTGRYLAALRREDNRHADELARRFGLDDDDV